MTQETIESPYAAAPVRRLAVDAEDLRRVRQMAEYVRTHGLPQVLGDLFAAQIPTAVIQEITQTCRLAHGAVAVACADSDAAADELAAAGMEPEPLHPSTVVRGRLAARHRLNTDELDVQITHVPVRTHTGDTREVEIFLVCVEDLLRRTRIAVDERVHHREVHFAVRVTDPRIETLRRLCGLLSGPALMIPDGGGFNPHAGPAGGTVLYFRTPGRMRRQWPRRLEVLVDGQHRRVLRAHLQGSAA